MSKSSGLASVVEVQGTRIQVAALREVGPVLGSRLVIRLREIELSRLMYPNHSRRVRVGAEAFVEEIAKFLCRYLFVVSADLTESRSV